MRFTVQLHQWPDIMKEARAVREAVFISEQNVPREIEWDADDANSVHAMARDEAGAAIGTGRLLPDGHIGRMAVLAPWRGRGVGRLILESLIQEAKRCGFSVAILNAQTHAIGFYGKSGFSVAGEEFVEADIPHVSMTRSLR